MMKYETDLPESVVNEIRTRAILCLPSSDPVFEALARAFPGCGSKIAWSRVPGMVEAVMRNKNDPEESCLFLEEHLPHVSAGTRIQYMGDSAFDGVLQVPRGDLLRHWQALYVMPQHHYVVPPDLSWCLTVTLEGFMNFGYRPRGKA